MRGQVLSPPDTHPSKCYPSAPKRGKRGCISGNGGYARVIFELKKPMCSMALTQKLGLTRHGLGKLLPCMHRLGLVHVAAWEPNRKGPASRVYRGGPGIDATHPGTMRPASRQPCRPGLLAFREIYVLLEDRATHHELVEASGLSRGAIDRALKQMRELRMVYIADWAGQAPVYRLGNKPDVPMKREGRAVWSRRYSDKKQAAQGFHALAQAFA